MSTNFTGSTVRSTGVPTLQGGCQCGAIRYETKSVVPEIYICHCTECRKQSASAFGISYTVHRDDLVVVRGAPKCWSRPAASGRVLQCFFCADCGTRVWHASEQVEHVSIKGGSLDEPFDVGAAIHIWTSSKLTGVIVPGNARSFPEEP